MEKIYVSLKFDMNNIHEYMCTFMIISGLILVRMRKFSNTSCRENQNTFTFNKLFFRKSCRYEIMWKNVVYPDRQQIAIGRMRFA
jgi:hypothetical protein